MVISHRGNHGILDCVTNDWDELISDFWAAADRSRPEEMLHHMRTLVEQRPDNDPDALYEWTSIHDYLGKELDAVALYRAALDHGLSSPRRSQAIIQLASSLRNLGDANSAIAILENQPGDDTVGDAAQAFLALALRDAGRKDQALRVALRALARTLPLYSYIVDSYAMELKAVDSGAS